MSGLTLALVVAAATLGSVHTLAPDHWMPFAALARAEGWSARRTALITACCGLGPRDRCRSLLGLVSVLLGLELLQRVRPPARKRRADFVLIAFGVVYGAWGLHRAVQSRWHATSTGTRTGTPAADIRPPSRRTAADDAVDAVPGVLRRSVRRGDPADVRGGAARVGQHARGRSSSYEAGDDRDDGRARAAGARGDGGGPRRVGRPLRRRARRRHHRRPSASPSSALACSHAQASRTPVAKWHSCNRRASTIAGNPAAVGHWSCARQVRGRWCSTHASSNSICFPEG